MAQGTRVVQGPRRAASPPDRGPLAVGTARRDRPGASVDPLLIRALLACPQSRTLRRFVWYRIAVRLAVSGARVAGAR